MDIILLIILTAILMPSFLLAAYLAVITNNEYALIIDARAKVPRLRLKKIIHTRDGQTIVKLSREQHNINVFLQREDLTQFLIRKGFSAKLAPVFVLRKDSLTPLSLDTQPPTFSTAELQQMLERDTLKSLMSFRIGKMDMFLYLGIGVVMGIMIGVLIGFYIPPPSHIPVNATHTR